MKPVARASVGLALIFLLARAFAAEPAPAAKADPAKGATIATATCAACHSTDGSRGSAANPIIHTIKNFPEDFKAHMATAAVPGNKDQKKADNPAARAATGTGRIEGRRDTVGTGTPAGD